MKKIILGLVLFTSSVFAFSIGSLQVSPEIGGNISYQNTKGTKFTFGGYSRIWFGISRIVIAPQVKYDVIYQGKANYYNLQAGGLIGFEMPVVPITPYIGVSWSKFYNIGLQNAAAFNYGVKFNIPSVRFLTFGVDGVYQAPKIIGGGRLGMNRIGVTLGVEF
ncbi:hypothetical protein [Helicobacter mustelae]|uniref:Putative outer membrane protein n=1 Tax=Helicobacter mustelae (strain ATCC 43772 / CCUG 25715 / CIP 103759 / LMG 18044 / NCTC 12198 / R85-136P) TaxID=679897 RepID=D3UGJ2_HELM1|nr:hypothetical protein [Helicobacter mustelae]CBG39613.1 Putative outer membrane protein [Helicobacter mustelae 12198]SQH71125.1 outer membrane protein [Helicobacter mustelae]STP12253.1 outer membrane protein [Helicobacter mustelae]